jgi:hypothetical protein
VTFHRSSKGKHPTTYRIAADRSELRIHFDEHFFNDAIVNPKDGTTALDINIAQVVQEVRAALYFIGTDGIQH